jgi:hypothetical protein
MIWFKDLQMQVIWLDEYTEWKLIGTDETEVFKPSKLPK